jgi:hypothetical protein
VDDYKWALSYHLLPRFKDHRLSEITVAEVDGYKAAKRRERLTGAYLEAFDQALEWAGNGQGTLEVAPAGAAGGERSIVESGSAKPETQHPGR